MSRRDFRRLLRAFQRAHGMCLTVQRSAMKSSSRRLYMIPSLRMYGCTSMLNIAAREVEKIGNHGQ